MYTIANLLPLLNVQTQEYHLLPHGNLVKGGYTSTDRLQSSLNLSAWWSESLALQSNPFLLVEALGSSCQT